MNHYRIDRIFDDNDDRHDCTLDAPYDVYGPAITDCTEDSQGMFFAGNGEYGSQVNFCPVCGVKAPKQIEKRD